MSDVVFQYSDLTLSKRGEKFFVAYDAGAHQIVMREDEISEADALRVQTNPEEMAAVLFELQKRLLASGLDPYVSNIGK